MKYNNKILEAIQKGIKLAVDDFDSLDTIEVQKKARIKDDVHMKDLLPWADLGLPSGTLWAKYNLGVNPDNLNTAKDWYGNYYSFEEANNLEGYTMPTKEQIQELIDETKSEWVENYKGIEGLNGRVFVGKNGNSIFIPAAGYYIDPSLYLTGSYCYCWSSSLYLPDPRNGYDLYSYSSNISLKTAYRRVFFRLSARPVLN